jgi:lysophospholipase
MTSCAKPASGNLKPIKVVFHLYAAFLRPGLIYFLLTDMNPHVATLRLFPGISGATIRAFCMAPIRGVVLETFGAGNAPQRADVMDALKGACDRGVVVVAITQCAKGSVSDAYETGRTLLQAGVVPGSDMTPEVRVCREIIDNTHSQILSNHQCALAKLSYLLSKSELSVKEVRDLIGSPLRGELSRPSGAVVQQPSVEQNMDNIQQLLSQFVRLTHPPSVLPTINVTSETGQSTVSDATAPWSWTAAEVATAEAVLFPFLVHLAAARDDLEGLQLCFKPVDTDDPIEVLKFGMIPGGIVNCLEVGSGRSPLHVAALNGNTRSVELLLRCGALVHLRDTLGHTALYLVSFLPEPAFLA